MPEWLESVIQRAPWIVGAVALVVGLTFGLLWSRWRSRRRMAKHRRMGARGEAKAWSLLERAGFKIAQKQVTGHMALEVDGVVSEHVVRADAMVTRGQERFVVEVKGGETAADPRNRHTRRQLLEYTLAFDADGVLLVDAPRRAIHAIRFPQLDGDV